MEDYEVFTPEGFSHQIFKLRYSLTPEETWDEACRRLAKQMAVAELPEKQKKYEDKFHEILVKNLFVPGGRIWYNSGRPNPQLLNCFVLNDKLDSKEGWAGISYEMILTSMTGGGAGIDFSAVRPRGAPIRGHRGDCPGPTELMALVNGNGFPIRAGGTRRVALMFSLDLDHPDVEEFLDAKLEKGKLQLANISVRGKDLTKFIQCVKNDEEWELKWNNKWGPKPENFTRTKISAKKLWNKIVKNAWKSAEPGVLNWELAASESNIYYVEELVTTNPCGEICLSSYDCCCLGHLVLPRFVVNNEVDWHTLGEAIRRGVRFLDNVLSVNSFPLAQMREKSESLRRIGMGTTGLADMLAMLGLKYGSDDGNAFIDKLFRFISKQAYEASVMLAVEKGPFPACDPEKHVKSGFMKRMPKKIKALVAEHGIRNCALLTQAPTGTVSILSGNVSSGIEPMFAPAYERRYWDKDERKVELVFHPLFVKFMTEGKDVSHFTGSRDLSVRDHMEVQKIVQKHIDNAVSKTINMPKSYSVKEMSKIWLEYLPHLKGTTFFREGSRGYVDEKGESEPPLVALSLTEAKKRYTIDAKEGGEIDCVSGTCEI